MLTLDRYLVRQIVWPTAAALALLLSLFTVFNSIRLMRSAALGNLATADIMSLVFAYDLSALEVLLPTAFFGALVMVLCGWHRSGEAYAAYCNGITPRRVSRPIGYLALFVALCVALLTLVVRPYAYELRYTLNEGSANLDSSNMQSQHFYNWDKDFVIQAQNVQPDRPNLLDVFAQINKNGRNVILRARAGQISETDPSRRQRIDFIEGFSYDMDAQGADVRITEFANLTYFAERTPDNLTSKRRAQSTAKLATSRDRKEIAEFQWRVSMPFISLLMALLAIELCRLQPQQSPYGRYSLNLVLYTLVFTSASVITAAVENGTLPVYPGVYSAVVVLSVVYVLVRRHAHFNLSSPQ